MKKLLLIFFIYAGTTHAYSMKQIDRAIDKTATKYNINRKVFKAILIQESRLKIGAINQKSKDYGIGQINEKTIKAFGFNKHRILTDLEYSVDCAGKVYADFKKRYKHREPHEGPLKFWSRYNTSRPSLRLVYQQKVMSHLVLLE